MRILVIEDDQKIARALGRALQQEKYAVDIEHTSDTGYAMASVEPYDLLIVDRMLPGEYSGTEVIEKLRSEKIHTPALLLTALSTINDKTTGLDSGADDYLTKPFAIEELLARVRALLRRPKAAQPTILSFGDLSLNTLTFEVVRAGVPIKLTSKEFALLSYLLANQNRPLSKDSIISHVWDFDADILPNTVEVYIKYLRAKIDKPFKKPIIKTIRGFGYQLKI